MKQLHIELIESFGYTAEADTTTGDTLSAANDAASLASTKKTSTGKTAGRIGGLLTVVMGVKEAYDQITALPTNTPKEEYSKQVTKIVSKIVAEYGLVYVGGILGLLVGGVLGPVGGFAGALAGLTGGMLAQYTLGDSVDKIVDEIVDSLYTGIEDQPNTEEPTNATPAEVEENPVDDIKSIQTSLSHAGFDIGNTGVDGKFGPRTMLALQTYSKQNNMTDVDAVATLLGVQPESVAESMTMLRKTLTSINEAPVLEVRPADILRNFKAGALRDTSRAIGAETSAAERATQDASHGYFDANKAATTAEKLAHKAGSILSGPVKAGADIVKKTGGALSKFAGNHKFLTTIAAMSAAGYAFNALGNLTGSSSIGSMASSTQASTSDPKIAELQQRLKDLDYPIAVTGVMDDKTKKAMDWEWGAGGGKGQEGEYGKGSAFIKQGLSDVIKSTSPKTPTAAPETPSTSTASDQQSTLGGQMDALSAVDAQNKAARSPERAEAERRATIDQHDMLQYGRKLNVYENSELNRILELSRK